jgi:NAD(P)-dependent dehydrogenase (short-subunit alcohol dehydrogenase family)
MTTALITGASRGLGLALARELAKQGWTLIIDARNGEALEAARRELAAHTQVIAVAGDVTDAAHRAALAAAVRQAGGLDALVNNAGMFGPSPQPSLLDYPLDVLEQVYRANVIAPLGVLQAVRGSLRPNARILNITSDAGVEPYPGWGGYGSSKAALEHLSAILAAENPTLKVYWVDPGDMRTQMHQDAFPGEDISDRPLPEDSVPGLMELLTGDLPGGRYRAKALHTEKRGVNWLNLVLAVDDFDSSVAFFRDHLGLPVEEEWHEVGHGMLLNAGRATIEIGDAQQVAEVDRIEVGRALNGKVRLALGVDDVHAASQAAQQGGVAPMGEIVDTPWKHRNQRTTAPKGVPIDGITLFQVMGDGQKDES